MSPDEVTLLETAQKFHYIFKKNTDIGKIIEINGED